MGASDRLAMSENNNNNTASLIACYLASRFPHLVCAVDGSEGICYNGLVGGGAGRSPLCKGASPVLDQQALKLLAKRADVDLTVIDGHVILRFGKGGGRGEEARRARSSLPYSIPAWVKLKIQTQKTRLGRLARLRGYDRI